METGDTQSDQLLHVQNTETKTPNIDNIRQEKNKYLSLCVLPFFGLHLVKQYKDIYPTTVSLFAIVAIGLIIVMNWRFSQSLGYKKWQSALGVCVGILWPIIPILVFLIYKYPRITGVKLGFFLGDKATATKSK